MSASMRILSYEEYPMVKHFSALPFAGDDGRRVLRSFPVRYGEILFVTINPYGINT